MPSRRTRWTLRCLAAAVLAFAFAGAPGASNSAPDPSDACRRPAVPHAGLHLLRLVPQQQGKGGKPPARRHQHAGPCRASRSLGKSRSEIAGAPDASAGCPAACRGRAYRGVDVARSGARRPVRDRPESGPHRYVPQAEPHGIPQRDSRPAGTGCRCRCAVAERLRELRIRQRDCRQPVSDLARKLRVGSREDQPACRRPARPVGWRHDRSNQARHHAGRTY